MAHTPYESVPSLEKSPAHAKAALAFEIVKYVIATKLAEEEAAKTRAAKLVEKQKLLGILAEKQDGQLSELSVRELKKRIADLDV